MSNDAEDRDDERFNMTESTPTMAMLNKSEIDQQVATAHAYPRSIKAFVSEARNLVTMTEDVAEACSYALPRRQFDKATGNYVTKTIEGPSARFAEIILSCWGNARAGTRIVDEGAEFITAQGFMFDLQKNVAIQADVPRRIVDSGGRRFKVDMIGVTASAAASIALRNAILRVIPKALWEPVWQDAKKTALGTEETLVNKRTAAIQWFQKKGASADTIFEHFGIQGIEDMTLEHIATLLGYKTALKEGDVTVESLFGKDDPAAGRTAGERTSFAELAARGAATPPAGATPAPSPAPDTQAPAATPAPQAAGNGGVKAPSPEELEKKIKNAKTAEAVETHSAWISREAYPDDAVRLRLGELAEVRIKELTK